MTSFIFLMVFFFLLFLLLFSFRAKALPRCYVICWYSCPAVLFSFVACIVIVDKGRVTRRVLVDVWWSSGSVTSHLSTLTPFPINKYKKQKYTNTKVNHMYWPSHLKIQKWKIHKYRSKKKICTNNHIYLFFIDPFPI